MTEVYFYHFSRKCESCEAIKTETPAILEALRPGQWESGDLVFRMVNLESKQGREIADRLGIVGQQVIMYNGDREIDLTQPAFLFAYTNPEKYREILSEELEKLE